jgi:hypothetical protein
MPCSQAAITGPYPEPAALSQIPCLPQDPNVKCKDSPSLTTQLDTTPLQRKQCSHTPTENQKTAPQQKYKYNIVKKNPLLTNIRQLMESTT